MADILLGQAYYLRFDPKLWEAQQPYAPLGTLYAASYLRERGHSVALFDAMLAGSTAEWTHAIERRCAVERAEVRQHRVKPFGVIERVEELRQGLQPARQQSNAFAKR